MKTVRAVVHVEAKVLNAEEEAAFFLSVGDHCQSLLSDFLFDRVEIVDQVVVKKQHPTVDAETTTAAADWRSIRKGKQ